MLAFILWAPAEIFVEGGGEGKRKKGHPAHAEKGPHKKKKVGKRPP